MPIERPVFIVSAPCAGTGPIFELLSRARHVGTLNHSARNELRTRLESNDIRAGEIRALVRDGLRGPGRWLSAIVANAKQIPLLNEAYPDALFIYVHRNAEEQLARMKLDGHSESAWSEATSRIMNDLAALPARRWCAIDIDGFLSNRPHEAALLGRFADLKWRVRPGPAQKARRASVARTIVLPELSRDAAIFAQANHASSRDLPEANFWKSLPENVAKAVVSSRLAASLTVGAAAIPAAASAATLTVTNNSDTGVSGDGSLRGEIAAANSGDTITFDPSLNGQTITLTGGVIDIKIPLTIQGPGSTHLTIDGDATAADGGGLTGGSRILYLYVTGAGLDGGAAVTISGLTLQHGNVPGTDGGGAIYANNTSVALSDVTVQDSATDGRGGGLYISGGGSFTLQDSFITGNSAFGGGGLFLYQVSGTALLDQIQVTGNRTLYSGGGVIVRDSQNVTIRSSTIAGNAGGILGDASYGGGLAVAGTAITIQGSTISGNSTSSGGAGVVLYAHSSGTFVDSTVANNTAGRSGGGVALYNSTAFIGETTIAGNNAGPGGGGVLVWKGSPLVMTNSIVAGNLDAADGGTTPDDVASKDGGPVQSTYSLIQSPGNATFIDSDGGSADAGTVVGTGNITGEDPLLGALTDNGGTTMTMLPGTGSPAINAGDPGFSTDGGPSTDQRGDTRVVGGRIDMGAVEVQPAPPDAGPTPVTDAGSTVQTSDAGTTKPSTTGKGCNCNGSGDAALALLTPIGFLLMRRRRRPTA